MAPYAYAITSHGILQHILTINAMNV